MASYLSSFWNAGLWSFFLIGIVATSFRLAKLPFDPILGSVLGVGSWICLLLLVRHRLIVHDVGIGKERLSFLDAGPVPSQQALVQSTRPDDLAQDLSNCLRASLARTHLTPQELVIEQVQSAEFRAILDHAEESIQLWIYQYRRSFGCSQPWDSLGPHGGCEVCCWICCMWEYKNRLSTFIRLHLMVRFLEPHC
jgi:hypothetical protein